MRVSLIRIGALKVHALRFSIAMVERAKNLLLDRSSSGEREAEQVALWPLEHAAKKWQRFFA